MPTTSQYSGNNRILAALPPDDFHRFFSRLEPLTLSLRQVLQDATQPIEHIYFVEEGVSSVLTIMANGSTIEVGMIGTEGMVGVSALLGDGPAPRVIVQIPGRALWMPVAQCKRAFDESATVRSVMLGFAGTMLRLSSQTAACNRLHSIEQRCARWLLMAHDRIKTDQMPMTHEFLASMLGVRRAGVTTTAGELQQSGLISYRQGHITIRDREGLEALTCECFGIDHAQLNHTAD